MVDIIPAGIDITDELKISPRFIGIPELRGVLRKHEDRVVARLQQVVSDRARDTKYHFLEAMYAEYSSVYATRRLANSITHRTLKRKGGVELRFYIAPFRELEFVTALFGGHFQSFPVTPFEIYPIESGTRIAIKRDPGRRTMRLLAPGVPAEWGKYTGGFSRDVLMEVSEEEGRFFMDDVYTAMATELASLRNELRR